MLNLKEEEFEILRTLFETIMQREGYKDMSDISGDETEDFCKYLQTKLDEFYANI